MGMRRTATCAVIMALATAVGMPGTAYAQDDGDDGPIPAWIKSVFSYYADGLITDSELIAALEYLISHGILVITPSEASAGGQANTEAARAEHAVWAADEAEFNTALATELKDAMQAFRLELRSGYIPGSTADYADVISAQRAEITAVESYAEALRTAAADGTISDSDRASIEGAGRAVDDASQAVADAVAASPMGPYMAFQEGLAAALAGGFTVPAPIEPLACSAPSELAARAGPDERGADEADDDAGYLDDHAQQRRQHLRDFEAGLSGAYTFRANGDFGSAGSSAASMAGGNVSAYDDMLGAIKGAIRAAERQAAIMERAAEDGVISAAEAAEITMAAAETEAAECNAAAEYDASPAAGRAGTLNSFMDGFR